ncbi:uncharacterized protein UTRI_03620_B [Ustilago trichophora]|uniref:Vacuolar protein sorting-associated protein 54 n=1 Tax=Ustilago trichophora TaxID=86804 RepID=A0A5C3E366_9BASI|nr:uncharacterized protein UTRI_03620_B [Ustilago trichophora]
MSTGIDEAAISSSRNAGTSSASSTPHIIGDDTASSIQFRNGIASPASPGSEADSTINSITFAPSILASRLGRSLYSSTGAAGSSLSLSGSGFNSPSLASTGFNAVSTVLNNPSKRQHPIDPKSSRFPPVTPNHVPADIPKVKKAELDPYLTSVRPEWDRFMRNQSMGRQGKATIEQQQQQQQQQQNRSNDSSYDTEPLGKANRRHRPTASMASLSADLQAVPPPQARKRLPNLSAVPQVFFSEDFDLGNPYTFDQVTERYKVASTSPAEQNGGIAPTYDVALNQMLQEKLSYYSDVIEQHLIIEIGQQSSSFFAALENLNDLNAEAESCLRKIHDLKSELVSIDEKQAKKGLRVIREQQHRRQLERKQTAVQNVRQIIERRDLVRLLLQQGETEEALDLLNKLRSALRRPDVGQEHAHPDTDATVPAKDASAEVGVALYELQCLASIPAQLEEMEQTLSGMLEQDLVAILRQDIDARLAAHRQDTTSSSTSANGNNYFAAASDHSGKHLSATGTLTLNPDVAATESLLTPSKAPASPFGHSAGALSTADTELESRIAPLVIGLAKTGGMEKAVAAYREAAIQAIHETWRETLSRPSNEMAETVQWLLSEDLSKYDDPDSLPPPAARIRDLEHSSFLNMGRELFEVLIECLKAIDSQCKLIPRILDQLHTSNTVTIGSSATDSANNDPTPSLPSAPTMPQGVPANLPAKLSEVVVASAEQAHSLCARLLGLRATTHAALELPPFLVVFQLCWSFVLSSEQLCRKMIVGLRGTVLSQAKGFLANFHRRRIERAAKAVEEETWAQAEVGAEIQAHIRQIVSSAVEDPADFVVTGSEAQQDEGSNQQGKPEKEAADSKEDATPALAKTLDIEDRQYFVVDASLDVLSLLVDYLKVIINLPLLTTEAMARVVEFLKQFNSRTCQVVLGAGAMRSAGLKNITAKHLALASQSLSIMISLIPYIRETVRRHLSAKQAVMLTEFDKLRRDFQEHQYEIHAKLVAIMSDRLTVHCRTLSAIDWNAEKPAANDQEEDGTKDAEPNKYAADLVKETATLHKVLSKYLQAVVVEHVIGQVLRSIDARIAQEFEKVPVQNHHALDRMQTDARYLGTKLSALKHVEWKDEALQQVLATKRIAPPSTVSVTSSAGPSAPSNEVAPGSPAVDKPAASPFGPVTYKPRIPNIFARRQQQQQQQQQQHSQSASPRASTDVPGTSTPAEAQRSVETTPRTSIQLHQQSSSPSKEGNDGQSQQATATAPGPPAKSAASGARSIEEEVNDIPPTPPSKTQELESSAIVKGQDADTRDSEDLVAPVVPAPNAVAKILAESSRTSSEVPAATAPAIADDNSVERSHSQSVTSTLDEAKDAEKPQSEPAKEAAKPEEAPVSQADLTTPAGTKATESTESPQPSTPKKDSRVTKVAQGQSAAGVNAAESSPVRSGASTPATATPSGTPAKPGRMSLKERLAEAAQKRAQQSAPLPARSISQAEVPAAPAVAVAPPTETVAPTPSAATSDVPAHNQTTEEQATSAPSSDAQQKKSDAGASAQTEAASAMTDVSEIKTEERVDESTADKEADAPTVEAASEEPTLPKQTTLEPSVESVESTDKPELPKSPAEAPEAIQAEVTSEAPSAETKTPAADVTTVSTEHKEADIQHVPIIASDPIDPADGESSETNQVTADQADDDNSTVELTANGTETSPDAIAESAVITAVVEAEVGQDGEDAEVDADADVDGDVMETTNDSTISSSKKNKKKKKKGKKK